jgi:hypothetical protein
MNNLLLIEQDFNYRSGCFHTIHLNCFETKLPDLKLKTRPNQRLGSLLLDIKLTGYYHWKQDA